MKENKQYRLKQWYPSLPNGVEVGHIIEFDGKANSSKYGVIELYSLQEEPKMWISSKELHPDFWEEVKQPLFVTDDGVELFDEADKLFIVNKEYYKKESKISNLYDKANRKYFKYFFYEANANEYIWRNKPVFSYEDFIKWANDINASFEELSQLAKERSEQ